VLYIIHAWLIILEIQKIVMFGFFKQFFGANTFQHKLSDIPVPVPLQVWVKSGIETKLFHLMYPVVSLLNF
jgi:hypothetical protein